MSESNKEIAMIEPTAYAFKDAAGRDCLAWSQNEALAHGQDGTMRPLYEFTRRELQSFVEKYDAEVRKSMLEEVEESTVFSDKHQYDIISRDEIVRRAQGQ